MTYQQPTEPPYSQIKLSSPGEWGKIFIGCVGFCRLTTWETTRLLSDWYDVFVPGLRRGAEEGRGQFRRRIYDTSPGPIDMNGYLRNGFRMALGQLERR